jgi:hypothetical protein
LVDRQYMHTIQLNIINNKRVHMVMDADNLYRGLKLEKTLGVSEVVGIRCLSIGAGIVYTEVCI